MAKSSKGAGKSLVRANLAIHEPPTGKSTSPGGLIKRFPFEFNPAQLSISQRSQWKATPTRPCGRPRSRSSWAPSRGR